MEEEEPFNPDYVEVERVLDVAVTCDTVTDEEVTHYLVCWRSLAYEDSTWELEQDVDVAKIKAFNRFQRLPTLQERQVCCHFATVTNKIFIGKLIVFDIQQICTHDWLL